MHFTPTVQALSLSSLSSQRSLHFSLWIPITINGSSSVSSANSNAQAKSRLQVSSSATVPSSSSSAPALKIVNEKEANTNGDGQQEATVTAAAAAATSPPRYSAAATAAIRHHLHGLHSDTLPTTVGDRIKALSLISTATATSPSDQSTTTDQTTVAEPSSTSKKKKKKPLSSKLSAATRSGRCSEEKHAIFNSAAFALDTLKAGGSHVKSLLEEVEFSIRTLTEVADKMPEEATTVPKPKDDDDADDDDI